MKISKLYFFSFITLILISCNKKQNSYLSSKLKNNAKVDEHNIILESLPRKLVYREDNSILFQVKNSIISLNPSNGKLDIVYNSDSLEINQILYNEYKIDTSEYEDNIKKYNLSTIKPNLSIVNFDLLNKDSLIILISINYPEIQIEEGEDTKVNVEMNYKRMIIKKSIHNGDLMLNRIELFSDASQSIGDMPETSFFIFNNKLIVGRSCFATDGTKYSIGSCYNISTLKFMEELPIYIVKSSKTERKKNGIEILHNYSTMKKNNDIYIENDNTIYNLVSNKPALDLSSTIKEKFYINNFFSMNDSTWVVEISTDSDILLYEIVNNKLNLIKSNSKNTIWVNDPTKNIFFSMNKDSLNYEINTYQF